MQRKVTHGFCAYACGKPADSAFNALIRKEFFPLAK